MARSRGFSLIELVTVLVLVGALAVFASAQFRTQGFERYAFREELISAAQYAQKLALASGCDVQLEVDGGGYALNYRSGGSDTSCGSGGFDEPVADPAGGGAYSGSSDAVTSGLTVVFGTDGTTDGGGDIEIEGVTDIRIEAGSGYVHDA
ncbi:MAG: pilus assembly FimT family protein [Halofilum sp. (in: g-proteobacteria)]